jgi:hypothetical protein
MGDQGTLRFMRTAGGLQQRNAVRKRLSSIRVKRLTFLTDHRMLTDIRPEDDNWEAGGRRYAEMNGGAHWDAESGQSFPASVTKGTDIVIGIELEINSADVDPVDCKIVGTCRGTSDLSAADASLVFEASFVLGTSAPSSLTLTGKKPLANEVFECPSWFIDWKTEVAGRVFDSGTSGPHHLYVTYDTPIPAGAPLVSPFGPVPPLLEDGITEKRMQAAVSLTEERWRGAINEIDKETGKPYDRNDPHTLVRFLMTWVDGYTLATADFNKVPQKYDHPRYLLDTTPGHVHRISAWPVYQFHKFLAECQAIVRFVRGVLMQIGCPGLVEFVVVYARSDQAAGAIALEDSVIPPDPDPSKYRPKTGTNRRLVRGLLRDFDHSQEGLQSLTDKVVFPPGDKYPTGQVILAGDILNTYEACLKFTYPVKDGKTRYYGGGVKRPAESAQMMLWCFKQLVWTVSSPSGDPGKPNSRVTEIAYPAGDPSTYYPDGDPNRWPLT